MKITISGLGGVGKGTTSKILKDQINYQFLSSGDFFRQMAKEKNMTAYEFEKVVEKNPEIDLQIDQRQKKFGKENDNFIFDSRLGYFFIPDSFKIKLICNEDTRLKRLQKRDGGTIKDIQKKEEERLKNVKQRYLKLYGIEDFLNDKNFDLIVDTENKTPKEVSDEILENIKNLV